MVTGRPGPGVGWEGQTGVTAAVGAEALITSLMKPFMEVDGQAPKEYDILTVPLTKSAFRTLQRNQGLPEEWLQYLARPSP